MVTLIEYVVFVDSLVTFTAVWAVFINPRLTKFWNRHNIKNGYYGNIEHYTSGLKDAFTSGIALDPAIDYIKETVLGLTAKKEFDLDEVVEGALEEMTKNRIKQFVQHAAIKTLDKKLEAVLNEKLNTMLKVKDKKTSGKHGRRRSV